MEANLLKLQEHHWISLWALLICNFQSLICCNVATLCLDQGYNTQHTNISLHQANMKMRDACSSKLKCKLDSQKTFTSLICFAFVPGRKRLILYTTYHSRVRVFLLPLQLTRLSAAIKTPQLKAKRRERDPKKVQRVGARKWIPFFAAASDQIFHSTPFYFSERKL